MNSGICTIAVLVWMKCTVGAIFSQRETLLNSSRRGCANETLRERERERERERSVKPKA
ncbi:MAG: hypothetical protein PUP91_35725 [Rhizonema sp. PD37]|nr:hypothetical protein [Rhizonema sp. PD37]